MSNKKTSELIAEAKVQLYYFLSFSKTALTIPFELL